MANMIPPDVLLDFYRRGVFPMADAGEVRLFSPDPRGIIPLGDFHIPRGTKKALRDPEWVVMLDSAFPDVMLACAEREDTWIDETIFRSYAALHKAGHAHSVEVWRQGRLAGGLYGVRIGAAFFGESMFHRVAHASKVALCHLIAMLQVGGFRLLDTQWVTPHLAGFGAVEIPRAVYLRMLTQAVAEPASLPDKPLAWPEVERRIKNYPA
ncbi:MAG: leucyl/phenylalanyl-tRNA--protein transferase [Verrucomicrobiaceae bacterium]|nr:MAG: leucyl/phenylalanyl-tRNA--protein transferase [Verrucomicrobiaceae bacterium]